MKQYRTIKVEIDGEIGILKFNRPGQLNAMNREMMDEIVDAIRAINSNKDVAVALIWGEGPSFMAGADIKEYAAQSKEEFIAFQEKGKQLYQCIEEAHIPWIAAVDGFALGGGFEIALSCDLIVASEKAKMGLPEVHLSLIPGGGGTQRLIQKVGINRVKEMLFFGSQYDAPTLYEWGIVNRVFKATDFLNQALEYARKLSRRSTHSIAQLKRLANLSLSSFDFDQRIGEEAGAVRGLFMQEEARKAIQDFIKKTSHAKRGK